MNRTQIVNFINELRSTFVLIDCIIMILALIGGCLIGLNGWHLLSVMCVILGAVCTHGLCSEFLLYEIEREDQIKD